MKKIQTEHCLISTAIRSVLYFAAKSKTFERKRLLKRHTKTHRVQKIHHVPNIKWKRRENDGGLSFSFLAFSTLGFLRVYTNPPNGPHSRAPLVPRKGSRRNNDLHAPEAPGSSNTTEFS